MEELLQVRVKDFTFNSSFMTILVGQKNDQHRDSHKIDIAEYGKISCPASITRKLIGLLGDEDIRVSDYEENSHQKGKTNVSSTLRHKLHNSKR